MGAQVPIFLKRGYPVLYTMGAQVPILLKRSYPFLYIMGAQVPILLKRDSPVQYTVGAQAPIFLRGKKKKKDFRSVLFSGTVRDIMFMQRHCFSTGVQAHFSEEEANVYVC